MAAPTGFELTVNEVGNALELELRRSINLDAVGSVRNCWKQVKEWAAIGEKYQQELARFHSAGDYDVQDFHEAFGGLATCGRPGCWCERK